MNEQSNQSIEGALNKIANILAHLLLNGMGEADLETKVKILRGCGFLNPYRSHLADRRRKNRQEQENDPNTNSN
jgi:hypothetical protein